MTKFDPEEHIVVSGDLRGATIALVACHRTIGEICRTPIGIYVHAMAMTRITEQICEEVEKMIPAEVLTKYKEMYLRECQQAAQVLEAEQAMAGEEFKH